MYLSGSLTDASHVVRRSGSSSHPASIPAGQLSIAAADLPVESGVVRAASSLELMEQDDADDDDQDSMDSEEDGLRQLLLLQQTKYAFLELLSLALSSLQVSPTAL